MMISQLLVFVAHICSYVIYVEKRLLVEPFMNCMPTIRRSNHMLQKTKTAVKNMLLFSARLTGMTMMLTTFFIQNICFSAPSHIWGHTIVSPGAPVQSDQWGWTLRWNSSSACSRYWCGPLHPCYRCCQSDECKRAQTPWRDGSGSSCKPAGSSWGKVHLVWRKEESVTEDKRLSPKKLF